MFWDLFKKKNTASTSQVAVKLPKPKDIPPAIGRDLVVKLKQDPDWVWKLRCVVLPSETEKLHSIFRVFDASVAISKGVSVKNYHSLDNHPELALFSGWYNTKTMVVHFDQMGKPAPTEKAA